MPVMLDDPPLGDGNQLGGSLTSAVRAGMLMAVQAAQRAMLRGGGHGLAAAVLFANGG